MTTQVKQAVRLEGVTVLADDVPALARFYVHGFQLRVDVEEPDYVALGGPGIRFAVFSRRQMGPNTHDHPDYRTARAGQSFELNFECSDRAEVDRRFERLLTLGATSTAAPTEKHWGHYTGFFADPEGNIHSLFAVLEQPG